MDFINERTISHNIALLLKKCLPGSAEEGAEMGLNLGLAAAGSTPPAPAVAWNPSKPWTRDGFKPKN